MGADSNEYTAWTAKGAENRKRKCNRGRAPNFGQRNSIYRIIRIIRNYSFPSCIKRSLLKAHLSPLHNFR
jgi:hypothetical protein